MFTEVFHFTAGRTAIYAYPASASFALSSTPWTTHRVLATELVAGLYSVTVDEIKSFEWSVFDGATVPTTHDDAIVSLDYETPGLDAAGVRSSVGLASANLDTQLGGIPAAVWASGARTLTSFGTLVADVATAVWAAGSRTLTAISDSSGVTTLLTRIVGTLATGTHNPQSGDAFARLGAPVGASLSADIQTRLPTSGYTAPPSTAAIATDVWSAVSRTITGGTVTTVSDKTGYSLSQAFPANFASLGINGSGDVLRVTLVDTTTTNTDMRGTNSALLAASYTAPPSAVANATQVRTELATELGRIDATISSRSTFAGGSVSVDASSIRSAIGLASANLDTQLAAIDSAIDVIPTTSDPSGRLLDVWRRLGLDPANPLVNTATLISAGPTLQIDVSQTVTTVTTARQ